MTRFFILHASQFRVNDLCLSKVKVQDFLQRMNKKFKSPHEFSISDISEELNGEISDKSVRAMIFIAVQFQIVSIIKKRKKKPKLFAFSPNAERMIESIGIKELSID